MSDQGTQTPKTPSAAAAQPAAPAPIRFKSTQDWYNYANANPQLTGDDLSRLRISCYKEIERIRNRPLIIYVSKFLEGQRVPNSIDLTDIEGFTDLVGSIPTGDAIDVLIHSPGGDPNATERIVEILRGKFNDVRFLVPHSAYSAATMLCLSGNEITTHPSATLGPIDPQINGIPARSIKRGFENAKEKIKLEGPETLPAYIPLIEKLDLHLLEICDDSENLSKELVTVWLTKYMFSGQSKTQEIEQIVEYFSKYDTHLTHSRPLHFKKTQALGLNINEASGPLKDLLWEAYILINVFLNSTLFYKLYESTTGISWGRQQMPTVNFVGPNANINVTP